MLFYLKKIRALILIIVKFMPSKKRTMKNENFSDLSTEELLKRQKTIKPLTILLIVTLILLFVLSLFITIKKGFTALLVVPIALSPIAILNLNNLKNIQKEINSRKNQN